MAPEPRRETACMEVVSAGLVRVRGAGQAAFLVIDFIYAVVGLVPVGGCRCRSGRLLDTFSNHSSVALLLLGSHLLTVCVRTCIIIVGLINTHRLAPILSTDFAPDFVFLFRITLQFHQALP